jgi:Domain of unknown function (DUF4351)
VLSARNLFQGGAGAGQIDRLEALGEALLDFNSLQDLRNWLEVN